jgi:hypothetical protein
MDVLAFGVRAAFVRQAADLDLVFRRLLIYPSDAGRLS